MPTLDGNTHIALTVTDAAHSAEWYARVFGFQVVTQIDGEDPDSGFRGVFRGMLHPESLAFVGLTQHEFGDGERFDERRTGLDHVGYHVAERDELDAWCEHLSELGVEHSGVTHVDYGSLVTLRDPDNIQLEIFWVNVDFYANLLSRDS